MDDSGSAERLKALAKEADQAECPAAAVVILERLEQAEEQSGYFAYLLADNRRRIGRMKQALLALDRVRSVPDDKRFLVPLCRSQIMQALGEQQLSEQHLREALALDPNETTCYIFLANRLIHLERLEEAEALLRRAQEAEGDQDEVWVNLGHVYRAKGDYAQSLECYRSALRIDPNYPDAQQLAADVERALGAQERGDGAESQR